MAVKVKGAKGIRDKLFAMQKVPEGAAVEIAALATSMIKRRTLAGRDRRNLKMHGYSKGYKRQQAKRGRSSKANLFNDGNMFRAMQWKRRSRTTAVIFFNRAEENTKALTHQRGKKGTESVKAHNRKIKQAFGKPIQPRTIGINAHERQADLPKREFFGLHRGERRRLTKFLKKKYLKAIK